MAFRGAPASSPAVAAGVPPAAAPGAQARRLRNSRRDGGAPLGAGWLNEAGAPVLVMHGTSDEVIPYALDRKLYDGLRVPKELMTVNAGHSMIPAAEPVRYYGTVTRFVKAGGPR